MTSFNPKIKVSIKNDKRFRAALRKSPQITRRHVSKGINKAIFVVGREAVHQVTSGKNRALKTGRLRSSILGGSFSGGSFGSNQGLVKASDFRLTAEVGPTVDYAIYVHEGTRFMRPRPFMTDALKAKDNEVEKILLDSVQDALNDIARRV